MRWLKASLLALALPLGAAGCVENDQSLVIVGNIALGSDCMVQTSGGITRPRGVLDIGLASSLNTGYIMSPRVLNQLPSSVGMAMMTMGNLPGAIPVEANNLQLVGFEVDIIPDPDQPITSQLQPGIPGLTKLSIPYAGGLLTFGGGSFTGTVEVINSNAASVLLSSRAVKGGPSTVSEPYQTLTVRIRARALRAGGIIFSNWLEQPIEVCAFCLANKPGEPGVSGYNPGTGSLFECPDGTTLDEEVLATSCLPQQDTVTTCCIKERQVLCGLQIPHKSGMM
jgi:hypothetical protein